MTHEILVDLARSGRGEDIAVLVEHPDVVGLVRQARQNRTVPRGGITPNVLMWGVFGQALDLCEHIDLQADFGARVGWSMTTDQIMLSAHVAREMALADLFHHPTN